PSGAQGGASACELKTIYFGFDEATLSQEARVILDSDWQCLQKQPGRITVAGNTDERGTTEYNLALGERRAEAVRKYVIDLGADAKKVKPISYGKERPVDPGHAEPAWAKNRRGGADLGVDLEKAQNELAQIRGNQEVLAHRLDAIEQQNVERDKKIDGNAQAVAQKQKEAQAAAHPTDKLALYTLARQKLDAGDGPGARQLLGEFLQKYKHD